MDQIEKDYATGFPSLTDRSGFNRKKRLMSFIGQIQHHVSSILENQSQTMIVDIVPVIKLAREKSYKAFEHPFDTEPAKGWSAVNKSWCIGYKLHVVIFDNGVVQQIGITKGNVHDLNFLKEVADLPSKNKILGDKAYISGPRKQICLTRIKQL